MQEQPVFSDTLSVEHVRNTISNFHALSAWKVVSRELTKNVPVFLGLVMQLCAILQCYLFGLYVYVVIFTRKLCFSLNLRFPKYGKFCVSVARKRMPGRLLNNYMF